MASNLTHLLRSIFFGNESPAALAKLIKELSGGQGPKGEKGDPGVSVTEITGEASGNTITFHFTLSNEETKDVEVTISGIGA